MKQTPSLVELRNFSVGYGNRMLVAGVNAAFDSGSLTSLIGRNGSGKSTLLRAIAGLNPHYSGCIMIDGDSRLINSPARAKKLAFVNTSRVRVTNMTCRDVVALGRAPYTDWVGRLTDADERIVAESLKAVGMEEFGTRTLDRMSDGECQRIMIARALAQDTPVILLDEPTSFLDLPNRYRLMQILASLAHDRGKCVILSTHELDIAMSASDRIALIDSERLEIFDASDPSTDSHIKTAFGIKNYK